MKNYYSISQAVEISFLKFFVELNLLILLKETDHCEAEHPIIVYNEKIYWLVIGSNQIAVSEKLLDSFDSFIIAHSIFNIKISSCIEACVCHFLKK